MYVSKPARERLDKGATPASPAELGYCLLKQCLTLLDNPNDLLLTALEVEIHAYLLNRDVTYTDLAAVLGALDGARREYRRRVPDAYIMVEGIVAVCATKFYSEAVVPYLELHRQTNGDIFS